MDAYPSIGIDLGQKHDPTAIVVAMATRPLLQMQAGSDGLMRSTLRPAGKLETVYTVREMGRLPLGTPYPAVYKYIIGVLDALRTHTPARPRILIDATGAVAAVDDLREALKGRSCTLIACTFTHGDKLTKDKGAKTASVGKAFLVNRLQVLLQHQRIELPASKPEAAAMQRELMDYEIRIDQDANDKYGAFKVGTHDDLATALGLAVLDDPIREAQRNQIRTFSGFMEGNVTENR